MTKKKKVLFVGMILIILVTFITYWFYFSEPGTFPKNKEVKKAINRTSTEVIASTIQDIYFLDKKHVFVPFISDKETYGVSYWVWKKHKWKIAYVDTKGAPKMWKIVKNDPSTHYLIWNIHPEDKLNQLQFLLIRNRNYQVTDGKEFYFPRVQMNSDTSLQEKSYGVLKLPEEWVLFINQLIYVEKAKQSKSIFHWFNPDQYLYIGWIPYDQNGEQAFPEKSVNGNGYSVEDIIIDYTMILNENDLE